MSDRFMERTIIPSLSKVDSEDLNGRDATSTVLFITNVAPHYREELWRELAERYENGLSLVFGKSKAGIKELDFQSILNHNSNISRVKNIYLGRHLIYQLISLKLLFKRWDTVIITGEVQVLSNWLYATYFRYFCFTRTVVWTHGLYGNESFLKRKMRVFFYSLFSYILVYNRRSKGLLLQEGLPLNKVSVIYNSFFYHFLKEKSAQVRKDIFKDNTSIFRLIFIGRITKQKNLELVLEALVFLKEKHIKCEFHLIGSGSHLKNIINVARSKNVQEAIVHHGEIYDLNQSSKIIQKCHLGVSPGNVGLTAVHLISLGVPVVTHNDQKRQMPEYEIIRSGTTGSLFIKDNPLSLANEILFWRRKLVSQNYPDSNEMRMEIDNYYNPRYQMSVIEQVIK